MVVDSARDQRATRKERAGLAHRLARQQRGLRAQAVIVVALGLGGVVGALARYAISLAMPAADGQFPWSTFVINMTGSAVLGFLLVLLLEQFPRGRLARPVIGTGVIGAYTTFSTCMVDAVELIRSGHAATAAIYVAASAVIGLLAVWGGMIGARTTLRAERWLQEELS